MYIIIILLLLLVLYFGFFFLYINKFPLNLICANKDHTDNADINVKCFVLFHLINIQYPNKFNRLKKCIVLCCVVLRCVALRCFALCCIVLYYEALY